MVSQKLIVVVMGPGKKHFAEMCLESVKDVDKILYWTSADEITQGNDKTEYRIVSFDNEWFLKNNKLEIFLNGWDEKDPATNGKCRQKYLDHLKEHYPNDWCLVVDEDEIVEDLSKIKDFIQLANPGIYNVKMRHFIGDLGHEDATRPIHFVPGRLFKISEAKKYPEHSHPILEGNFIGNLTITNIWHLGHLPVEYMHYIVKRYKQHAKDSIIHAQDFLIGWKNAHLFGEYPKTKIKLDEIPPLILKTFDINFDELYFSNRKTLELKHFLMLKNWLEIIDDKIKKIKILDIGCGMGHFGFVAEEFLFCEYEGIDISKYAVENSPYKGLKLRQADITKKTFKASKKDLIICSDILEHLEYDKLDIVLKHIKKIGDKVIFSIPFRGDPNLDADKTHKIKEDAKWWIEKLSKYFTIKPAPKNWLFSNQILVGEQK